MKTFKIFLAGFALSAAVIACYAFVQESKAKVYDYISILDEFTNTQYVTYPDGKFEKIKTDDKRFQFSSDMMLINKFEKEGYELFYTNDYGAQSSYQGTGSTINIYTHYLLRREHKL